MPRPLRLEYENAFYHVMNRGRGRQSIFHGQPYYKAFLNSIEEANQRFGLIVHAYCLMGNHYHLLVQTPRGDLSLRSKGSGIDITQLMSYSPPYAQTTTP